MPRFSFFGIYFALLTAAFGDQITLSNGDRVTGSVVKKDGATLVVKSALMGEVSIKWADVKSVKTDEPVNVVIGDKTVQGKIETEGERLAVVGPSAREVAALAEVVAVRNDAEQKRYERYLNPPLSALWAGYFDIGLASTQGNARSTTWTTALLATRVTNADKMRVYANQVYARGVVNDVAAVTARAIRGGWGYDRGVGSRAFLNLFNDYEFDRFQNLDLRFVAGGGAGYTLLKGERGQLSLLGGASYNRENFSVPVSNGSSVRNSAEAYWGDELTFRMNSSASVRQAFRMFNNLTNRGEYRANFDLGLDTKLSKWLSWQGTFSNRYITNPAPGRRTNDVLISTGLRLSFAR
ncbi:MAG: DUF481 domain-containing protein [Bryobacteraceae bacterium]|nr:DUF481 domain-containing protein [Bryobacteraceae bacterium]